MLTNYSRFNHNNNDDGDNNKQTELSIDQTKPPTKAQRGRKKSKKGPFICLECRKEFCNQSTLTKHMITHSDERKFICQQCSKAFKRHDHLNGHMLTHREQKPYACDLDGCDKSYCDARSLRRHKEKHKENNNQSNAQFLMTTSGDDLNYSMNITTDNELSQQQQQQSINQQPPTQQQQQQTKGLNEVMFSPITPVTPLKNGSQFTFEFSNNNNNQQSLQSDKDSIVASVAQTTDHHQTAKTTTTIITDYVQTLDETDFECFDTEKNDNNNDDVDLLRQQNKSATDIVENFVDHHQNEQEFFTTTTTTVKHDDGNDDVVKIQSSSTTPFNSFDLPSNKLTSDLFNRRIQRNINNDENNNNINRTKELLSIKQIAASLESFNSIYQQQQQQQQIASMSNDAVMNDNATTTTPTTNHQFNFIFPDETSATPATTTTTTTTIQLNEDPNVNNNELIDSTRNFDIDNCLDDDDFSLFNQTNPAVNKENNIEQQIFRLDPNQSNHTSNIQFNDNSQSINNQSVTQPSNEEENLQENDYFPHSSLSTTFGYDNGCSSKSNNNIVQFITSTSTTETIKESMMMVDDDKKIENHHSNDDNYHEKIDDTIMRDINDNYVIAKSEKKTEQIDQDLTISKQSWNDNNNLYPRIKSPNNFIRSLNKKLSAISNEYNDSLAAIPIPPPPPPPTTTTIKKKRPRPEPLYIPPHVNTTFVYHSRLRSPRLWNTGGLGVGGGSIIKPSFPHHNDYNHPISPPPYTPPPMLSPVRSGSGLFWKINNNVNNNKLAPYSNTSQFFNNNNQNNKKMIIIDTLKENQNMINETTIVATMNDLKTPTTAYEELVELDDIPTTDIQPHVNIGPQFQARIPTFNPNRIKMINNKSDRAVLIWNPTILDDKQIDNESLDLYFKISCSMCVNGHGNNKEYALHLLYDCGGDLIKAMSKLIQIKPTLSYEHPLHDYYYANHDVWNENEIILFQKSILKFDKDFFLIADEIKTKSVKECVQFYYLWKKNSIDHFKRLRILRRKRESMFYDLDSNKSQTKQINDDVDDNSNDETMTNNICGKKFRNLKSRSAHMRVHI
ncbi:Metal ion binding [Dermatophagoides pteronyssinus]|uniref:Metal ion binding n=1 Tax=Dermatophagoides pteronyssinus TaxID=6956 RepID=A0ABQ8J3U3_DERPT|nr:Metal ion binding [Dermatophagoides pteronyssinus]